METANNYKKKAEVFVEHLFNIFDVYNSSKISL